MQTRWSDKRGHPCTKNEIRFRPKCRQGLDCILHIYIHIYIYIDMGAKNSQRLPQKRNFGALAWSHLYKQTNIHAGLGATGTTGKSFRVVSCMRAEGVYNSGQQALGSWSPFSFSAPGGFPFSPPPPPPISIQPHQTLSVGLMHTTCKRGSCPIYI